MGVIPTVAGSIYQCPWLD